ncbi:MAG TPA: PQQ-binding-like beta-propeller repeat protein [Bryobacteraceae bacterium]|jgi:outer membrane protein assembly factor BamB|nr:PQQ-binding-like beta-propeller repeat protein [Bryobacteraceae bacterium]
MGLLLVPILLSALALAAADDWPGWRGPTANGISPLKNVPSSWSAERNVAWKTPLEGRGLSSPVVWGDRIFLTADIEGDPVEGAIPPKHRIRGEPFRHPDSTGMNHKHILKVMSFDTRSGKKLWENTAYNGPVADEIHKFNSYASATTVTDGKFVYAYFESQGLYKYDFEGKQIWKMSLGPILTEGVGNGVSPVLFGDKVIILADQDEGENSFLAAVSTVDGKIAWKIARQAQVSWTVPVILDVNKQPQLLVSGTENLIAYDPRTGKEIWRTEGVGGNSVHTPVFGHGMVYVSTGYPTKNVMAVRLNPAPGEERVAWTYKKGTGYIPNTILYGDYLYFMTDAGLLTCVDAVTGKPQYESKRFPTPGHFAAAPVAFDGKLLITSQDGDTYVLKAGPEHEILGTNSLGEDVVASLAIAGDSIYIRSEKNLYRIRQGSGNIQSAK